MSRRRRRQNVENQRSFGGDIAILYICAVQIVIRILDPPNMLNPIVCVCVRLLCRRRWTIYLRKHSRRRRVQLHFILSEHNFWTTAAIGHLCWRWRIHR